MSTNNSPDLVYQKGYIMTNIEITIRNRSDRKRRPSRGKSETKVCEEYRIEAPRAVQLDMEPEVKTQSEPDQMDTSTRKTVKSLLLLTVSILIACFLVQHSVDTLNMDIIKEQALVRAPLPMVILTTVKTLAYIIAIPLAYAYCESKRDQASILGVACFGIITAFAYYIDCNAGYVSITYLVASFGFFATSMHFILRKTFDA